MKKKLKRLAVLFLTTVCAMTMTACGTTNKSEDTNSSSGTGESKEVEVTDNEAGTASEDSAGVAEEVVFWGTWSGDQGDQLRELVGLYNEAQNKYQVTYMEQESVEDKLLTAVVGGTVPDIVMWDRYQTSLYASKGVLMSLDDLISRDQVNMQDFYESTVGEMSYDGKQYGIPSLVDVRVIFYNKDLFEQAGITKLPTNWSEMEEAAVKLTKWEGNTLTQSGFALNDMGLFNIWIGQAGGNLVTDDETATAFNSQAGLDVLNFWDKLLNEDKVYQIGWADGSDPFAAGNLAMKYDGPWSISNYKAVDGLNWGVMEPFAGNNGDKNAITGGYGLVIPNKAKNVEGAWDFLKWCTTVPANDIEFAKISGWLPANIEAGKDPYFAEDEIFSVFVDTMAYAKTRPTVAGYSDVEGLALTPQLQKFISGSSSAEEALMNAQSEGDQILKEEAME